MSSSCSLRCSVGGMSFAMLSGARSALAEDDLVEAQELTTRRACWSGSLVLILANLQRADLRFQGGRRQAEPFRRSRPPGHLPSGLRERSLDHLSLAPDERVAERQDRRLRREGLL